MDILICHPQIDFRARLKTRLQEEFQGRRLRIDEASNENVATEKLFGYQPHAYNFLITTLDLPPNPELPLDQSHRGLLVAKSLYAAGAKTESFILIPGEVRLEAAALFSGVSCTLIGERMEMLDDIIAALRAKTSKSKARPRLSLKLVQDPNSSAWNFWLDGDASFGLQERKGAFAIQPVLIDKLAKRSRSFWDAEDWLAALGDIGQELYAHFFDQGNAFSELFRTAVKNAGGIDSVRFSFDIRRDYYSLAIEALVPPEEGLLSGFRKSVPAKKLPFWMLRAPIYRSVSPHNPSCTLGEQPRPHLFNGKNEPINCLIIQADASGRAQIPGTKERIPFNPILCVREECEQLEELLNAKKKQWKIGEVKRVREERNAKSFKQQLRERMAEDKWHLVHFCGHSHYHPEGRRPGTGYLLLPGKPLQLMDARSFAHQLQKTQFLFLSSCETSEEGFAFEMARNGLPAVLGFRGGVNDQDVPGFVKVFYENLFASRSIESAFVTTRRKMRKDPGVDNPLWASPILVLMHPEDAQPKAAAAGAGSAA
jgi:hypothetical protein